MHADVRALALVAAVMLVAGCMTSADVITDKPWKLVSIGEAAPVDPEGIVGVDFGTDGRFRLNTGCRSGGGTYHIDANRIRIDAETLQPSPCDAAMVTQDGVLRGVLDSGPRFGLDTGTGQLRLTGEDGMVLLFVTP